MIAPVTPNPVLTLDELTTPLTEAQVESSMYAVLESLGVSTTSWKEGSPLRTFISAAAIIQAAYSLLQSDAVKSGFLKDASGDWLVIVARYGYGVEVEDATFAAGGIFMTNTGGGVYHFDVGDYVALNPTTNKTYTNKEAFDLGVGESVYVDIIANEAGSASTAIPNSITKAVTALSGVVTTNPRSLVGNDRESDAFVRTKCLQKLGSLSPNGPWDAYAYAARIAKRTTDDSNVGVTRTRIIKDGFGRVDLYCATPTGGLDADDVAFVDRYVQTRAAPLAVSANTYSASVVVVDVTYTVFMYNTTGYTEQQIKDAIALRLAQYMSIVPIGGNSPVMGGPGYLFLDDVRTVIGSTFAIPGTPKPIFHVVTALPLFDLSLGPNQIPELGTVTGTINQVPPSAGY